MIIDIDEAKLESLKLKAECLKPGTTVVKVDPKYFRPTEVDLLIGDPSKSNTKLGWKPKYNLEALIKEMVLSDLHLMHKDEYLKKGGFNTLNYFE